MSGRPIELRPGKRECLRNHPSQFSDIYRESCIHLYEAPKTNGLVEFREQGGVEGGVDMSGMMTGASRATFESLTCDVGRAPAIRGGHANERHRQ